MTIYKSVRIIDGVPKWIISDQHSNIVDRDPTNEKLRSAVVEKYSKLKRHDSKPKLCCICGNNNDVRKRYYDDNGNWDGESRLCDNCYTNINYNYIQKMLAGFRNGNLDPLSTVGKGFIGQQIIAKKYNVDDCNLKMDNFHFYVDLSKISGFGYCEVKISGLHGKLWKAELGMEHKFDTVFVLCMDKNVPWIDIERAYVIPESKLYGEARINIYKDFSNMRSRFKWVDKFRVDEKDFNDIYHTMKLENCKILRKNS